MKLFGVWIWSKVHNAIVICVNDPCILERTPCVIWVCCWTVAVKDLVI